MASVFERKFVQLECAICWVAVHVGAVQRECLSVQCVIVWVCWVIGVCIVQRNDIIAKEKRIRSEIKRIELGLVHNTIRAGTGSTGTSAKFGATDTRTASRQAVAAVAIDHVIARATCEDVVTFNGAVVGHSIGHITRKITSQRVIARAAVNHVIARPAIDFVCASARVDGVIAAIAKDHVIVAVRTVNDVTAAVRRAIGVVIAGCHHLAGVLTVNNLVRLRGFGILNNRLDALESQRRAVCEGHGARLRACVVGICGCIDRHRTRACQIKHVVVGVFIGAIATRDHIACTVSSRAYDERIIAAFTEHLVSTFAANDRIIAAVAIGEFWELTVSPVAFNWVDTSVVTGPRRNCKALDARGVIKQHGFERVLRKR